MTDFARQENEDHADSDSTSMRLQRALAMAGLGSRRHCEELITEGRVEVDGEVVSQLGTRVDPDHQKITVDGERIKFARFQYYAVNKPQGVVSTSKDPAGRTRVIDLIKTDYRVYNVGRLDQSSEGLIIVTNDGDLANRLTHPKYGIEKTYLVQTVGVPTPEQLQQLERGVFLAEGKAQAQSVKLIRRNKVGAVLEMVLAEGRNREIRRLLARLGHKVTRLQRVAIGPVILGIMGVGEHRKLSPEEVQALKEWRPENAPSRKTTKPKKPFRKGPDSRRHAASHSQSRSASPPGKSSRSRPLSNNRSERSSVGPRGKKRGSAQPGKPSPTSGGRSRFSSKPRPGAGKSKRPSNRASGRQR